MTEIKPFPCLRPNPEYAANIAALPYDVYDRNEAREFVSKNPLSFLKIDRAEAQLPPETDIYSNQVYQTAADTLQAMTSEGYFINDVLSSYYVYELTAFQHVQTGLVGCAAVDDYLNGTIKKHENTRSDKELDRICHIEACQAQTGPIFLTYQGNPQVNNILAKIKRSPALYSFTTVDQVTHRIWQVGDIAQISELYYALAEISSLYIADGHHRAAAAVKVAQKRREEHPHYNGEEEYNYFLSVLFPEEELKILPYNRVVYDLNGHTEHSFLNSISKFFDIEELDRPYAPKEIHKFGMYLNRKWYLLSAHEYLSSLDRLANLDVSILQNNLLNPILGIENPKTDKRIGFIGGVSGLREIEDTVNAYEAAVGFSLHPTSMHDLLKISDSGKLMPPKSTWFEPKLLSGLFIHKL